MKEIVLMVLCFSYVTTAHLQCPTQVPSTTDTCIVGASQVNLTATGGTGKYAWYDAASGGNFLGNGTVLTTPVVSTTTNFYVASQGDNHGLDFDGNNDYVAIQNFNYSTSGIPEVTVEVWIKTSDPGAQIIASYDRSDYWRLGVGSTGAGVGKVSWSVRTNSGILDFGGNITVNDGVWHHIAAVYDNGTASIYVDGVLDATASMGSTMGTGSTRFGFIGTGSEASFYNGPRGPNSWFQGQIDEFRIWDAARTLTDIQSDMNRCLTGSEPNLDLYYQIEDGTGSTSITDIANSNTGNLFNMSATTDWVVLNKPYSCPACESARTPVEVEVNNTLSLDISGADSPSCIGTYALLDAGSGFDSYLWSNGASTQTITANASSQYWVKGTLGNCASSDTVNITVNGTPSHYAVELDGANDYAAIDNFFYQTNSLYEVSVEAWIRTTDGGNQIIASFDRSDYWRLGVNGDGAGTGRVAWNIRTNAGILDLGGPTRVDDGNWHHVVGIYDNGFAAIYVDGELDASANQGNRIGTGAIRYGFIGTGSEATVYNGPRGPSYHFDGEIDELRIWGKALSQAEIRAGMCRTFKSVQSDLNVHFNFDEGTGTSTNDQNGAGVADLMNVNLTNVWQVASAPIGDTSSYIYPGSWSGQSLSLQSCSGDEITVSNVSGSLSGIHIYLVEQDPNSSNGISEFDQFNHYYGVFQIDGGNENFDIEYDYANHPLVNSGNEPDLELLARNNNADPNWVTLSSVLNLGPQTITATVQGTNEFILDSRTFEWTGNVNSNWNTAGNWLPIGVPPASSNILIPDVTNQPVLDINRTVSNLTLEPGATLDLVGLELNLVGNLIHEGQILSNGGTLNFSSSDANQRIVSDNKLEIDNLVIDNPFLVTNMNGSIDITGTLDVRQGSFVTSDSVTLISNASGTARINEITGTGILGEIVMERYIDAGETYWRFFSSAVQNATIEDYNDDFATAGYNGSLFPFFGFTSIYTYDEGNDYVPVSSAAQIIETGQGLTVWSGDTITGTQPFVVDLRGVPHQGTIQMPVDYTSGDGWNLVGNPYASTIDWDSPNWNKQRMANATYILNPDTEQYATYINGASANGGSPLIASQQAFWVVATAANPVLEATEGVKSPVDQAFFKSSGGISPGMHIKVDGFDKSDECVMRHVDNANQSFDSEYDAYKRFANWDGYPHISLINPEGVDLTVHSFDKSTQEWAIPLRVVVFESGSYDILFSDLHELNVPCIKLEDTYTGQVYDVQNNIPVNINLSDTTWYPRFILHIGKNYNIITESVSCFGEQNGGFTIELDSADNGLVYSLSNMVNVQFDTVINNAVSIDQLSAGIYTLAIPGLNNLCQSEDFEILIPQPQPVQISSLITDEIFGNDGEIEVTVMGGTGPYAYYWGTDPDQTYYEGNPDSTNIYQNLGPGSYYLVIEDANGCLIDQSFSITNVLSSGDIIDQNNPITFTYQPNDKTIRLKGTHISGEWNLFSVTGELIKSYSVGDWQTEAEFQMMGHVSKGMYILQGGNTIFRFVN